MPTYLSGVARGLEDEDLAEAVARQRLLSRLTDHPVAPLSDCVQLGRAVGLSMSEMQRLTGLGRQTLYRHGAPSERSEEVRRPAMPQAAIEVLMLLAAEGGFAPPLLLGRRAGLPPELVSAVVDGLETDGLCVVRRDDYASAEAALMGAGYMVLREHFDDLLLRRPDAISVYIHVPDEHQAAVARGAEKILAGDEHVLMSQSTAPSVMVGSELAVMVNAPTIRRALLITRDIWSEVLDLVGVPFFEPVITNVIPPGTQPLVRSDVLDAFVEAIVDAGVSNGDSLGESRARFGGGLSEAELAGRCVTTAALALRRAAGNDHDPRTIVDGDTAFAELQPAEGVPVPGEALTIKGATVAALEVATDQLGPLPGGRLGSFRAPGGPLRNTSGVRSGGSAGLVKMARLAGEAVGVAHVLGVVDAHSALTWVLSSGGD